MYHALIRTFQRWYEAQQTAGHPNWLARLVRDAIRPQTRSANSPTGDGPITPGNMPTRPPRISKSPSDGMMRIDGVIGEDMLALGIPREFLDDAHEMDSGQIAAFTRPRTEIVKFFTALEVLTGLTFCPYCGANQPEEKKGPSCLHCSEHFAPNPYRDGMKARADRDFLAMDGVEFEHEIARLFTLRGYHMQVTQASRDGGIDIVGAAPGIGNQKIAVQCKRYATTTVGIAEIQRFWGIIAASEYATGYFVTTSTFSGDSWQFAKDKPRLVLIDGQELREWRAI